MLVVVALIFGVNMYAFNASRLAGNTVPMPFGVGMTVVLSGSMEPKLSTGDLLLVVEKDEYFEDEIIVFQEGRMAITHRIVTIEGDEITTCGDANNTPDDPITKEQIKGKVVLAIPLVGYLVNAIKTPIGTIVILAAAFFLLERSFRAEKEENRKKLDDIKAEIEKLKQESENNS